MAQLRILVTGAEGFLGRHVVAAVRAAGHLACTTARNAGDAAVDLAAPGMVSAVVEALQPDVVLHLAAMSRMDQCGRDPAAAEQVNGWLAAEFARRFGARLMFTSTDLVFDGQGAPYAEDATPAPLSAYGLSKVNGEQHVRAHGGRVVRLPLLFGPEGPRIEASGSAAHDLDAVVQQYGPFGRGATGALRRAAAAEEASSWFTNEYRTPLHVADAARALVDFVVDPDGPNMFHLPGPERVSRWELAQRFCALQGLSREALQPSECHDANRPRDVSLLGGWRAERSLDDMLLDS
ncbi:MAG: NAD(P)-dependent oxidoreductase [Planctomycetota bacterium]